MNAYAHFYKYVETLDDLKYDLIKHMKDLVYNLYFFGTFWSGGNNLVIFCIYRTQVYLGSDLWVRVSVTHWVSDVC